MLFQFGNVLAFLVVAVGFIALTLAMGRFFRPRISDPTKATSYECGERPVGSAWINFNSRFFLIALIFLVFEVEIVLIYPVATVFKGWIAQRKGGIALVEILIFILILIVALAYAWAKGDLDWIRPETTGTRRGQGVPPGGKETS